MTAEATVRISDVERLRDELLANQASTPIRRLAAWVDFRRRHQNHIDPDAEALILQEIQIEQTQCI